MEHLCELANDVVAMSPIHSLVSRLPIWGNCVMTLVAPRRCGSVGRSGFGVSDHNSLFVALRQRAAEEVWGVAEKDVLARVAIDVIEGVVTRVPRGTPLCSTCERVGALRPISGRTRFPNP